METRAGRYCAMSVQRGVIDNRALSVVIALAGTYLALSLMVLCLVEMISSALSRRARFLRDGIVNLVGPEDGKPGAVQSTRQLAGVRPPERPRGRRSILCAVQLLLAGAARRDRQAPDGPAVELVKELTTAVVGDASVSVDEAERRLSVWFDAAMDRLSGAYKRNTQRVSLALAVVITVAGNVDSIRLSQMLWTDSGARARVEALARDESKACEVDRARAGLPRVARQVGGRRRDPARLEPPGRARARRQRVGVSVPRSGDDGGRGVSRSAVLVRSAATAVGWARQHRAAAGGLCAAAAAGSPCRHGEGRRGAAGRRGQVTGGRPCLMTARAPPPVGSADCERPRRIGRPAVQPEDGGGGRSDRHDQRGLGGWTSPSPDQARADHDQGDDNDRSDDDQSRPKTRRSHGPWRQCSIGP